MTCGPLHSPLSFTPAVKSSLVYLCSLPEKGMHHSPYISVVSIALFPEGVCLKKEMHWALKTPDPHSRCSVNTYSINQQMQCSPTQSLFKNGKSGRIYPVQCEVLPPAQLVQHPLQPKKLGIAFPAFGIRIQFTLKFTQSLLF